MHGADCTCALGDKGGWAQSRHSMASKRRALYARGGWHKTRKLYAQCRTQFTTRAAGQPRSGKGLALCSAFYLDFEMFRFLGLHPGLCRRLAKER